MTHQERLAELIEQGATIQLTPDDGPMMTLTLAGALWLTLPNRLRWCAIFPEHQGHVHETEYHTVKFVNGERDIAFYRDGRIFFYIAPYIESPLDENEVREALAKWRDRLGRYNNAEQFADFLKEA